jgi:hypothetical protein
MRYEEKSFFIVPIILRYKKVAKRVPIASVLFCLIFYFASGDRNLSTSSQCLAIKSKMCIKVKSGLRPKMLYMYLLDQNAPKKPDLFRILCQATLFAYFIYIPVYLSRIKNDDIFICHCKRCKLRLVTFIPL